MDREDQRCYFVVGSVFMEIVTPLFRQKLVNYYTSKGFGSIHDFINSQSVKHILFHLRHRNTHCCQDQVHCYNSPALPVNYSQWDLLYAENPGPGPHNCHCKFTANQIQLDDLDITLASLILLNCCNLGQQDENVVRQLRQYKNDYLSHNTKGQITETEYHTLWTDLESFIQQLDPSKEDDLIRIEQRPLDQPLCDKYLTCLLDLHKKLDEMDTKLDLHTELLQEIHDVQRNQTTKNRSLFLRGLSSLLTLFKSKQPDQPAQPKLGQSLFTFHNRKDLSSVVDGYWRAVTDIVMMDDGRLVICLPRQSILLVCNTDGSQVDSIDVQGGPCYVTAVNNNSTVAVTLYSSMCIEMYDINNKLKLKSIPVPVMWCRSGITTINNKLVVGGNDILLIIDHQTGKVVQTIQIDCDPWKLHGSGDRIFYFNNNTDKTLYWYSYTNDRQNTLTLPSHPRSMTILRDSSLYVVCRDRSVQHVSSDGKQYKPVKTLQSISYFDGIHYNLTQRKLVTIDRQNTHVTIKVFNEI